MSGPGFVIPAKVNPLTAKLLGINDRPIQWSEFDLLLTAINNQSSNTNDIQQGGNTFGTAMSIGTNDNNIINVRVNNSVVMRVRSTDIQNSTGTIIKYNRQLVDAAATPVLDWANYQIIDSDGNLSIDWENRNLKAPDGTTAVGWAARSLSDATSTPSVDWGGRTLYSAGMLGTTLDWEGAFLKNPNATVPNTITVDWTQCILRNNNGDQTLLWDAAGVEVGTSSTLASTLPLKVRTVAGNSGLYVIAATPEGLISSSRGYLATDVTNGELYIKRSNSTSSGWDRLIHTGNVNYTVDATTSHTVVAADDMKAVGMTNTGARAFVLPNINAVRTGFTVTVSDEANNAATNNITVSSASVIIGGVTISTNGGFATYRAGTQWIRIG